MKQYLNETFDEERALYGSDGVILKNCSVHGARDGESILKESSDIHVTDCFFDLRYPFWHDKGVEIENSQMTPNCRAALWYSENVTINNTTMHGIKALRECENVGITSCDIVSPEFGWFNKSVSIKSSNAVSEYFMLRSTDLHFNDVTLKGKYSFQYIENSTFENCVFDTKDSFWHAKNTVVRNCTINGEYLAWYCENVTFINCKIRGTQPLCYCKNLVLIDCEMTDADLAFEKSSVNATVTTHIVSIKNPSSGKITAPSVGEIIMDDADATAEIVITD